MNTQTEHWTTRNACNWAAALAVNALTLCALYGMGVL